MPDGTRYLDAEQIALRCSIVRGGTSKGIFFLEHDIPPAGPARDALLKRVMGTPDVMQIDGLGGTHLVTSKLCIISRSERPDADVNYTFAQCEVERDVIDYSGNCGNLSAAVGPFAIDAGLFRPTEPVSQVRIYNTNTDKVLVAHVPVVNGRAKVKGDFAIGGVPGTGAEIFMDYRMTTGAKTGKSLPTGNRQDKIALDDGRVLDTTICDVANPTVFIKPEQVGLRGDELPDTLNNPAMIPLYREVRGKAAEILGFVKDWRKVDDESPFLPFLFFVAPPTDYINMSGKTVRAADSDLKARQIFMNHCNESMPGTGSMCLAAASHMPGTVVNEVLADGAAERDSLRIAHPNGIMRVTVATKPANNVEGMAIERLGFGRTARKMMDGTVYVPTSDAY